MAVMPRPREAPVNPCVDLVVRLSSEQLVTQGESYEVSAQVFDNLLQLGIATWSLTKDNRPYIDSRDVDKIVDADGAVEEMTAALNRLTLRPWRDALHALELGSQSTSNVMS